MKSKLKAAVIGYGKMGRIRENCIRQNPNIELIAVCDPHVSDFPPGVRHCQHYEEILSFKPDVIFACTSNRFLPEIACFFLRNGVHVFCEKPPGRCKEDVLKILEAERRHPQVKLKFGFNHRYHQAVLDAKSLIDRGRLGKVLWMRGVYGKGGGSRYDQNWRNQKELSGGGILIDQGIHMVDLFRLFAGEFDEVKSFIGQHYWPVAVEDNAFALFRNACGQVAMLHSSATQWQYKFLLEIYLQKGYITISGILSSTKNYGTESLRIARCLYDKEGYPLPNPEETVTYYDEDFSWKLELEEFIDCIARDIPVKVGSSTDAYQTMLLIERAYAADESWNRQPLKGTPSYEDSRLIK